MNGSRHRAQRLGRNSVPDPSVWQKYMKGDVGSGVMVQSLVPLPEAPANRPVPPVTVMKCVPFPVESCHEVVKE